MEREQLSNHVFDTYLSLRAGMAVITFLFPIVVVAAGYVFDEGLPIQRSLSAYYWASNTGFNPARIPFVGGLFAIGAFLYLYKGFSVRENIALNVAAVGAVGAACFPMAWTCAGCGGWTPHGIFAIFFFGGMVYVVWFRSSDTLGLLPSDQSRKYFAGWYAAIGFFMALSPLIALTTKRSWFVIFVEALGIWAFAVYWLVKTSELKLSRATNKALAASVEMPLENQASLSQILLNKEGGVNSR
jgi:hypothetical protein